MIRYYIKLKVKVKIKFLLIRVFNTVKHSFSTDEYILSTFVREVLK